MVLLLLAIARSCNKDKDALEASKTRPEPNLGLMATLEAFTNAFKELVPSLSFWRVRRRGGVYFRRKYDRKYSIFWSFYPKIIRRTTLSACIQDCFIVT